MDGVDGGKRGGCCKGLLPSPLSTILPPPPLPPFPPPPLTRLVPKREVLHFPPSPFSPMPPFCACLSGPTPLFCDIASSHSLCQPPLLTPSLDHRHDPTIHGWDIADSPSFPGLGLESDDFQVWGGGAVGRP